MPLQLKGLRYPALLGTSLLALAACDCGYNAGYLAALETDSEQTLAAADQAGGPASTAGNATRLRNSATRPSSTPASASRSAADGATAAQEKPASSDASGSASGGASGRASARASGGTPAFAPLRPAGGGGGAIIRVNNPGGGNTGGGNSGGGDVVSGDVPARTTNGNNGGILDPIVDPIVRPVLGEVSSIAKITVIDTKLVGTPSSNQLIGAGVGTSAPVPGQLVSVNALPANGSSAAAVNVVNGNIASASVLPGAQGAQGRSIDSLAAISAGNAPVLAGGRSPLVSVNALPNLSGGGVLVPGAGTPGAPAPGVPAGGADVGLAGGLGTAVGNVTAGLGVTAGVVTGGLLAPPAAAPH